jgi:hypothetical protein
MTALTKYQRLEATALWRDAPGTRARDVVVGLRDKTLILTDPRSEMPLSQWSLPAIQRLNPGSLPARFAPGEGISEEIELDDPDMIDALTTVHRVLERRRPHPGRLRAVILGGSVLATLAVVFFWLPGRLNSYTASVLPQPARADLGDLALADLTRLTGQPCKSVTGRRAASALAARLFPDAPPRIEVLRDGLTAPAHLPGDLILLPLTLIEGADSPDLVAGHVLNQSLMAQESDPARAVLAYAGTGPTLRLLTTGALPADSLRGFGEGFLASLAPPPSLNVPALIPAFQTAQVSTASFAESLGTLDSAKALQAGNPYPLGAPTPVLSDEVWLELQAICSE